MAVFHATLSPAFHSFLSFGQPIATIVAAKRSVRMDTTKREPRKLETADERHQRNAQEAQLRKDQAAAEEAAIDRMIRSNIRQFGP